MPIMRTELATTALKMPMTASAFRCAHTEIPDSKQASKQASKPLLKIKACFYPKRKIYCLSGAKRQTGSIGEAKRLIKTCLYPTEIHPISISIKIQEFKTQYPCVLKKCIDPILQPRSPAMGYRGCLFTDQKSIANFCFFNGLIY